ncbi:MAG: peptidylprolyl isomerase [Bacteroidetes bacterium GWF2_38_335]|nr:MAG: peptidylprolyl isomerase [Bacteroidetes bacterium GWF2_38_335]OFY81685.1 MAG: peptidylprolyl isomerase [Bacteroidetes bacterium RIFOXYA12_FULL_38_20]HBS87749.1 peptidylprolyl isomerase [Bacteroidales bacterium]
MSKVKLNDTVQVHYTGKLANGEVFDSSEGREPLEFTIGEGSLIPGFEKGVIGMALNEKKTINIPCDEAYGKSMSEMIHTVERAMLPQEIVPEVGMQLVAEGPEGEKQVVIISAVTSTTVSIDYNHPLAGKDLIFEVEVINIS